MNFGGDRTPYKRTRTHYVTKIRYVEQLSAGNSTEHARGGGGEEYSREFLVGVCRAVPQILTLFQTKK